MPLHVSSTMCSSFDILLTVHLSIILVINQLNAQILSQPVYRAAIYKVWWYPMLYNKIFTPWLWAHSARDM